MTDFHANMVLDSISETGKRLPTMQTRYPRSIHSEVLRHRLFSGNARSSRAVPVRKLIEEVRTNPVVPIRWLKNKPGMQGGEPMTDAEASLALEAWLEGAAHAADTAERLNELGLHKQWTNRVLEPYLHIDHLISATEWDNFWHLRIDAAAQPEIYELARVMQACMDASTPRLLKPGQWHRPYFDDQAKGDLLELERPTFVDDANLISVGRCARISYKTFEGGTDITADLDLAARLQAAGHWSPFEHVATPDPAWEHSNEWGNFRGWRQLRRQLPGGVS